MARSHALVHCSILDSSLSQRSVPAQLLYRQLLERRERNTLGVIIYRPATWAKTMPGLTAVDVEDLVQELEQHEHVIVDRDTLEVVHRTHMHHDGVLKQAQVIMAAAKVRPTVESLVIGEAIDAQIPPALRDRWPTAIATGNRKQVQAWLEEVDAASYKPPRKATDQPNGTPPPSPTPAQSKASASPAEGQEVAQRQAPVTGDRCPVSGEEHPTAVKTPQPPHSGGAEPKPDHHGQHANCRRCGTNPRGTKPPEPTELQHQAADAIAKRHSDPNCDRCHDTRFLDAMLEPDGTWGPAPPCPDCTSTTEAKVRSAFDPGGAT